VESHGSVWATIVLQTNEFGCDGLIDGLMRISAFLLHPLPMHRVIELYVLRRIDLDVRHAFL
jgi:aspartate carbamoyltransferase catalytic subunit